MKKILSFAIALMIGLPLLAQEDMKPKKYENVTWYQFQYVTFKADKVWEAKELIKHFEAASEKSETHFPKEFWFATGKADMMLMWKLEDGPSELEWAWSEESIKWWQALIELEGSKEAANEIMQKYNACVASTSSQLVRKTNQ